MSFFHHNTVQNVLPHNILQIPFPRETRWHTQPPRRPHHSQIPHPKNQLLHPEIPLQIPLPAGSTVRTTHLDRAILAWDNAEREGDFGMFEESQW